MLNPLSIIGSEMIFRLGDGANVATSGAIGREVVFPTNCGHGWIKGEITGYNLVKNFILVTCREIISDEQAQKEIKEFKPTKIRTDIGT